MIGYILKSQLTRGVIGKRWNNFPRINDINLLDNTGFKIHVALFLSFLEKQAGNKVDEEFIIKKIIFESCKNYILSDINAGTREYISNINNDILNKIEKKTFDYILSFDAPSYLKEDFLNTINNKKKSKENLIIQASKEYVGFTESELNKKFFSEIYENVSKKINCNLNKIKKDLNSLNELMNNKKYQLYLNNINRLSYVYRWNFEERKFPVTVMSHLVIVTYLTYVISTIENNNGGNYPVKNMLLRAIYHDVPEAITGDIISPTKELVDGFKEILLEVEKNMLEDYLFKYTGEKYKNYVKNFMLNPFEGENGKIVKYADNFSALLESKVEINYGSNYSNFGKKYHGLKKMMNKIDLKSINYLLKDCLDSFLNE